MPEADCELQELVTHRPDNRNNEHVQAKPSIPENHSNNNGPNHPAIIRDLLFEDVTHNNEQELNYALSQATEEDFRRERMHWLGKRKILTIACVASTISVSVFRTLFEYTTARFGHLDFTEPGWYYWEPIHFAAYHCNVAKLSIIVNVVSRLKLNALSIFSENALHALLEYGRRGEAFDVQLSNGWESRICHVIAKERREVVLCAKLLIDAGIDVNHNNIWNETPLIIAIRYRLLGVIELLLKRRDIDLDTCIESFSGKSARDMLTENEICMHLITPNTIGPSTAKTLFTFLKSRNEEMFLRYNNENIRRYVNQMDGDEQTNTSWSMLQLCLIKGYIDYEKEKATSQEPHKTDILKSHILKYFCQKGFGRSIEHLLNNGADITKRMKTFGDQDVFQMAVKFNYYPFLAIVLGHQSNQITQYHILEALRNIKEGSFEANQNGSTTHVLVLLISKLEMLFTEQDMVDYDNRKVLNDILELYLRYNGPNDQYKENICQILRLGASLTGKIHTAANQEPIEKLQKISYETLRNHLDECISSTNEVCYESLIRDEPHSTTDEQFVYSETDALHYLSHDPKKGDLLNHPALVYFIHRKWLKSSKFFYMNLALNSLFLAVLYIYMVCLQINIRNVPLTATFTILLVILTFKELVQCLLYYDRYYRDILNYLEVSIIVCCFINVFLKNEVTMIVAILLSTFVFLLQLGQLPKFTKYMIIFSSTKYFLEYATFYFIQFVSFAICFFILLPSKDDAPDSSNALGSIMIKLFDTLIFFIGQYDGDITSHPKFPILGRVIVAIFIFCMTIILNNLLVGLIVTDMATIQKTRKQQRQVKIITYITKIEDLRKKLERFARRFVCLEPLSRCFQNTKVFREGKWKKSNDITEDLGVFDDDDKAYLKMIQDTRVQRKNVLNTLYAYIISDINMDHKGTRDNRDIMMKLSSLGEKLKRGRAR